MCPLSCPISQWSALLFGPGLHCRAQSVNDLHCYWYMCWAGEAHVPVWQAPLPSQVEYWASDCVSDGTNRCWVYVWWAHTPIHRLTSLPASVQYFSCFILAGSSATQATDVHRRLLCDYFFEVKQSSTSVLHMYRVWSVGTNRGFTIYSFTWNQHEGRCYCTYTTDQHYVH